MSHVRTFSWLKQNFEQGLDDQIYRQHKCEVFLKILILALLGLDLCPDLGKQLWRIPREYWQVPDTRSPGPGLAPKFKQDSKSIWITM